MKLCKDCRFAALVEDDKGKFHWRCEHPTARFKPDPDYVTGSSSISCPAGWHVGTTLDAGVMRAIGSSARIDVANLIGEQLARSCREPIGCL